MFNRTAEYLAHGARSLGPLARLQPEQRRRVEKSSEKISKVLGERPIVDITSSSGGPDGITSEAKQGKKGGKSKKKGSSPPILRLKVTPLRRKSSLLVPRTPRTPRAADTRANRRPLKPVPESVEPAVTYVPRFLPPGSRPAVRISDTSTLQDALFLSPLTPLSLFSPIATAAALEQQYQEVRQLAFAYHALYNSPKEVPPVVEATERVKNVGSYLDLYRVANRGVRDVDADLNTAYAACMDATNPDDAYAAYVACPPLSPKHHRRRSSSFSHGPRSGVLSNDGTPIPRSSYIVPHSASAYSFKDQPGRYSLVIQIPSPLSPTALISFTSSAANSSHLSRSRTLVLDTSKRIRRGTLSETSGDESCPLQKQQREARARAVFAAMGESAAPASTPPVPQTPARTPHGPYWVRQSYRTSGQGSIRRRKSSTRVPPTPCTVRRERRQGWGGEWKAGKMGAVVEGLKDIKTPLPRASWRLTDEEVPPVLKDFIVIQ
ncbi:hypothetical protein GSI_10127 [Ganoderma sinense ZZ0214-1]|uniref:Uncharacterized protein n=1 Tax=Ganoderma sinense ZZ0214-1 TaxID=1077348 RepID=A0A2G8S0B0_9APHY|nr:hypothetical protein GSI_10127 [Ganoderma sinense ZZ0214-1]